MHANKTLVGVTGELEVYSGSTLSEPKATPLEVTYKDRAGEVDRVVKYKRVSTRTTIFGSSKTEETVYKLKRYKKCKQIKKASDLGFLYAFRIYN